MRKSTWMNALRSVPSVVRMGAPSGNRMVRAFANWPVGFACFKAVLFSSRIYTAHRCRM